MYLFLFYKIVLLMKESKQFSWNCMGSACSNQQQILIMKKKQSKDNRATSNQNFKSQELKSQIQTKNKKKSLKKRSSSSNIASDIETFQQQLNEIHKNNNQSNINHYQNITTNQLPIYYSQQTHPINHHSFIAPSDHQNFINYQLGVKQKEYMSHYISQQPINFPQQQQNMFSNIPQNTIIYNQQRLNTHNRKIGHKIHQNNQNSFVNNQEHKIQILKIPSKLPNESRSNKIHLSAQRRFETQITQHREDTQIVEKQSIIIQNTQSLLKIRKESRNQFPYSKMDSKDKNIQQNSQSPKSTHKMIMKIANSDYEDGKDSESSPSEVIGKGFDNNYQDFWQKDQVYHAEQTASRSTNTKLSTLYNNKGLMSMSQAMKPSLSFGTSHNFKSYKNL